MILDEKSRRKNILRVSCRKPTRPWKNMR